MGPRVAAAQLLCVLGAAALASADEDQCHFDRRQGWNRTKISADYYYQYTKYLKDTYSFQDTIKELAIPNTITEHDVAIQTCADMTANETDCWKKGQFQLKLPILVNGTLSEKAECHCFENGWQTTYFEKAIGTGLYQLVECEEPSDTLTDAPITTTAPSSLCPSNQSPCANGLCKSTRKFCDGFFDCRDHSDEVNCSTSTVTTTTTLNVTTTNTYEAYGRREALAKLRNKEDDSGLDSGTMTIIIVIAVVVVVVILLFTLVLASGKRKKSRQQRARDMMKRASMASAYNFANPGYGQEPGGGGGGGDDDDDDDDEDDGSSAVAGLDNSSSSKSKSNSGTAAKDFYGGGAGYLEVDGSDDDDDDDDDSSGEEA